MKNETTKKIPSLVSKMPDGRIKIRAWDGILKTRVLRRISKNQNSKKLWFDLS